MIKTTIIAACFITLLGRISFSQDTINFKAFDSLKTSAEDKHKHISDSVKLDVTNLHYAVYSGSDPDNWDVRLFRKINNNRSLFKDRFFNTFDRSMLPVSLLLPASMLIYSRGYSKTYDENSAYLLTAAEFTNMMLTFGTKLFVKRQRPVNSLEHCYTKGEPLLDLYSFPSGHTSTSFSIATMFALRYPAYPQVYAPMYAWALIVAYGRPYFGMHYPTDLIAGAIYGTGSSILVFSLRKELMKLKNSVLNEDKKDEGSIQAGVVSFFVGSFIASSLFNNIILTPKDGKRLLSHPGWITNAAA